MTQDKITVDDPLISTDVDSLIHTIAEYKRISLMDLRSRCTIDKKNLDKWISVLEEEGFISIEYGIRGTYIIWKDGDSTPQDPLPEVVPQKVLPSPQYTTHSEGSANYSMVSDYPSNSSTITSELNGTSTADDREHVSESSHEIAVNPADDEPEPEELLSKYLEKKKNGTAKIGDVKSNILLNLRESESPEEKQMEKIQESYSQKDDGNNDSGFNSADNDDGDDSGENNSSSSSQKPYVPSQPLSIKPSKLNTDVRALMNSYMDEINRERSTIESLQKDRDALYREKFATVEGKLQADLIVLTEKVIEKQSKVTEIRERALELPDKMDELAKLQGQMDAFKKDGRDALMRARARADGLIVAIEDSRDEIESKIQHVSSVLNKQSGRVSELEKLNQQMDARSTKLRESIDSARLQIDEISKTMTELIDDLQEVEQMKGEIDQTSETVRQTISAHSEELVSLENELNGVSKMEHWVEEYVRDYEQKLEDVEQYVSRSEDDLAELKDAAESLYMKKYLQELESIAASYEGELYDAITREKDISAKISHSKERIGELVRESQEMIRKLRNEVSNSKDFGELNERAKASTSKAKSMLGEKKRERTRLTEESKSTRKSAKNKKKKK